MAHQTPPTLSRLWGALAPTLPHCARGHNATQNYEHRTLSLRRTQSTRRRQTHSHKAPKSLLVGGVWGVAHRPSSKGRGRIDDSHRRVRGANCRLYGERSEGARVDNVHYPLSTQQTAAQEFDCCPSLDECSKLPNDAALGVQRPKKTTHYYIV